MDTTSNNQKAEEKKWNFITLKEVGTNFWNIRGSFKIMIGLIDIGTHMSVIRLSSGNFLIIDTVPLTDQMKLELDVLTENGKKIEAVIATHPFHTLSFPGFHAAYPHPEYYGTPRHLRRLTDIKWAGNLDDCKTRSKWSPEVEMRIPDGAEFVNPLPEKTNHFNSVFVFHKESKTIHIDDTIMYAEHPGFLLKLGGFKTGSMQFHLSMKGPGLLPNPESPFQFRDWLISLITEWDFDNICTAHFGNKVGGAKQQLKELVQSSEKLFQELSDKKKKKQDDPNRTEEETPSYNVKGEECG